MLPTAMRPRRRRQPGPASGRRDAPGREPGDIRAQGLRRGRLPRAASDRPGRTPCGRSSTHRASSSAGMTATASVPGSGESPERRAPAASAAKKMPSTASTDSTSTSTATACRSRCCAGWAPTFWPAAGGQQARLPAARHRAQRLHRQIHRQLPAGFVGSRTGQLLHLRQRPDAGAVAQRFPVERGSGAMALLISPHLDDVCYSVAGLAARARAGAPRHRLYGLGSPRLPRVSRRPGGGHRDACDRGRHILLRRRATAMRSDCRTPAPGGPTSRGCGGLPGTRMNCAAALPMSCGR
jgi:hypothetical protein